MAEIRATHTREQLAAAVSEAARALSLGDVVALPTETVYGLAANAFNPTAVAKIFSVKGRPPENPLIVHVASVEMARRCVAEWPGAAEQLAAAFWPGPLTLVLPKAHQIPDMVTAGGRTVGIRWPRHAVTEAIIRQCGLPLAAPSANRSGQLSPTTSEHVRQSLGDRISLIVDGGPCPVGVESTVLDLTTTPPRILRPGMVHEESLAAVIGPVRTVDAQETGVLRSPGLLLKHYAPRARLVLWDGTESGLRTAMSLSHVKPAHVSLLVLGRIPPGIELGGVSAMPREPEAFAQALYAELHRCDDAGARLIVVEQVPGEPRWAAIRDRLCRAAA